MAEWPYPIWGLHTDNGPEFVNHLLHRYTQLHGLQFTRSRPCRKNDNAHVEQRNRQLVREIVGCARYDHPEQVDRLNRLYECLDLYANLFLPTRKLVAKAATALACAKPTMSRGRPWTGFWTPTPFARGRGAVDWPPPVSQSPPAASPAGSADRQS